jgi:hypothetical protein
VTNQRNTASPEQIEHEIAVNRADIAAIIEAIQRRVSPWRLVNEVFDGARDVASGAARGARRVGGDVVETGSDFANNLGRTVRNNPVPVVLLGIGLTWLYFGSRRIGQDHDYRTHERMVDGQTPDGPPPEAIDPLAAPRPSPRAAQPITPLDEAPVPSAAATGASDGSGGWPEQGAPFRPHESTVGAQTTPGQHPERETGSVKETLAEVAAEMRRHVPEIGDIRERAGAASAAMTSAASRYAGRAREGIGRAGTAMRGYGTKVREAASEAGGAVVRTTRQHPLLTAAGLFAVGAGLAALLPRTRREDAWMGQSADAVRRTIRRTGSAAREELDKAASEVAHAARSSAEEEGLVPGQARETARNVVESATEVVRDTAEAAREEVDRRLRPGERSEPQEGDGTRPAGSRQ